MSSAKQDPAIAIQITTDFRDVDVSLPRLKRLIATVCTRFGRYQGARTAYEISLGIVDDIEITRLNNQFLGRNVTTDCLSFDLSDDKTPQTGGNPRTLELIVNGQMAVREADLRGHSAEAELALYITHGLLHNFGFDDSTPSEARKIHDAEDRILQELGYGPVYNKDTDAQEH
ncbi:MAG: rRNA maturation RNase YbeY [Phycisphaerales bacterium]|nr:MAG: rRNA maturation RNase YbeY [Phycisphaerales bacterium]